MTVTEEEVLEAYLDCRKKKRGKLSALAFEVNLEENIADLADDLRDETYQIGTSVTFVVTRPKYREVFAADFRDRVVHHLLVRRLEPILEGAMFPDSFSCRKSRGTLYGVKRLKEMIRVVSDDYKREAWVLKCDIKGFFMHINKQILADMLERLIRERYTGPDVDGVLWLTRLIVTHRPETKCDRHGSLKLWDKLDPDKSLFTNGPDLGLAIGNLTSQIFANYYLNDFDFWMAGQCAAYGRYVDDFFAIDTSKERLLQLLPLIRHRLADIGLTLHPNKVSIQSYTKGVKFTGYVVKYERMLTGSRTVGNLFNLTREIRAAPDARERVEPFSRRLNSYYGFLKHTSSYAIRRRMWNGITHKIASYAYMTGRYSCVKVKKRYKYSTILYNEVVMQRFRHRRRKQSNNGKNNHSRRPAKGGSRKG